MNNKGFTLIELLAVVILLITISLFVMPRIVDVIKDGDKTKENITKNKIIEAAKEYVGEYNTTFLNDLVNVGDSKYIDKEELINNKLLDTKDIGDIPFIKVKVILKEDNKIEYIIVDSATVSRPNYGNAVDYINNLYDIEDFRKEDGLKKDNTSDANIRYEGANPNNYVSFNDELWRIIGVFGDNIKLVRSEELRKLSWDSSDSSVNNGWGVNEWSQADLKEYLNTNYYGGTSVTCYVDYNNSTTTCPTGSLNSTSKSMINNYAWNTGAINVEDTTIVNLETIALNTVPFYNAERGSVNGKICTSGNQCNDTVTRTTTWQGYVALPYVTDWAYASSETACATNINDGLDVANGNYDNMTCKKNNWMHHGSTMNEAMWMFSLSTSSGTADYVWFVNGVGIAISDSASSALSVFPSVYLNTEVKITSGSGTSSDPYILEL